MGCLDRHLDVPEFIEMASIDKCEAFTKNHIVHYECIRMHTAYRQTEYRLLLKGDLLNRCQKETTESDMQQLLCTILDSDRF